MKIHLISSGKQTKRQLMNVLEKVHRYADYIHLRERNWSASDFLDVIEGLVASGVPRKKIVVNDRVDIAHITRAGAVQLGSHSLPVSEVRQYYPYLRIGCSVHSTKEAIAKEKKDADYLLYGHIFTTASKPELAPRGVQALQNVVNNVTIPVIAIGGIEPSNVHQVKKSGAKGIALLSGVFLADDPIVAASSFYHAAKGGI